MVQGKGSAVRIYSYDGVKTTHVCNSLDYIIQSSFSTRNVEGCLAILILVEYGGSETFVVHFWGREEGVCRVLVSFRHPAVELLADDSRAMQMNTKATLMKPMEDARDGIAMNF